MSRSDEVVLHLIKAKYLPVLLYRLDVCPVDLSDMRSLEFTVKRTDSYLRECYNWHYNYNMSSFRLATVSELYYAPYASTLLLLVYLYLNCCCLSACLFSCVFLIIAIEFSVNKVDFNFRGMHNILVFWTNSCRRKNYLDQDFSRLVWPFMLKSIS